VSAWLAEEYQAGANAIDLARKYNLHRATVWRHLARAGVQTGKHFLTDNHQLVTWVPSLRSVGVTRQLALVEKAHRLRGEGLSLRKIAEQMGPVPPVGSPAASRQVTGPGFQMCRWLDCVRSVDTICSEPAT